MFARFSAGVSQRGFEMGDLVREPLFVLARAGAHRLERLFERFVRRLGRFEFADDGAQDGVDAVETLRLDLQFGEIVAQLRQFVL